FDQSHGLGAGATGAGDEGSAMYPDHDRVIAGFFGCVYVEEQAVLVDAGLTKIAADLRAGRTKAFIQLDHTVMGVRERGAGETLRLAIADATEDSHARLADAGIVTLLGGNSQRIVCRRAGVAAGATPARQAAAQADG